MDAISAIYDELKLSDSKNGFYKCTDLFKNDKKLLMEANKKYSIMTRYNKSKNNQFELKIDYKAEDGETQLKNMALFLKEQLNNPSITPESLENYLDTLDAEQKLIAGPPPQEIPDQPSLPINTSSSKPTQPVQEKKDIPQQRKNENTSKNKNNSNNNKNNNDFHNKQARPNYTNKNDHNDNGQKPKQEQANSTNQSLTNNVDSKKPSNASNVTPNVSNEKANVETMDISPTDLLKNLNYYFVNEEQCIITDSPQLTDRYNTMKLEILRTHKLRVTCIKGNISIRRRKDHDTLIKDIIQTLTLLCGYEDGSITEETLMNFVKPNPEDAKKTVNQTVATPQIPEAKVNKQSEPPKQQSNPKSQSNPKPQNIEHKREVKPSPKQEPERAITVPPKTENTTKPTDARDSSNSNVFYISPELKKEILKYILFLPPQTDFTSIEFA